MSNLQSEVAGRMVQIVRDSWYGHGWTDSGGDGTAHVASMTCLLASGYKAAYQMVDEVRQAKDSGETFYQQVDEQNAVVDLVNRAIAQAIRELFPDYAKSKMGMDYRNLVMGFNDNYASKAQAIMVAERAKEIIDAQAALAEAIRNRESMDFDLPTEFSLADVREELSSEEVEEVIQEAAEVLEKAQEASEGTEAEEEEVEEKRPRRKHVRTT